MCFFRIEGLTCDQILGQLEEEDDNQEATIVLFPPDEDEVTDEDSDEEDEDTVEKNSNHLGKGILSQQAVLVTYEDEELPDLTVVSAYLHIQYIYTCIYS